MGLAPSRTPNVVDIDQFVGSAYDVVKIIANKLDSVYFTASALVGSVKVYGATGDGVTDDTAAIQAAIDNLLLTGRRELFFPAGRYRIRSTLRLIESVYRGGIVFKGEGALWPNHADNVVRGSVLVWDAYSDTVMFEIGGSPLFTAGVVNPDALANFNTQFRDINFSIETAAYPVIDVHDGDSFQMRDVFIDANGNMDVRGFVDLHGTIGNVRFQNVTHGNITHGYFCRAWDGAGNFLFDQVFSIRTAMTFWLGDSPDDQGDAFGVDNITFQDGTFEGIMGDGKWVVSSSVGIVLAGNNAMTVATGEGTQFEVDDPVYIDLGFEKYEMNRITSVVGDDLTFAYPLEFNHADGIRVVAGQVWLHTGTPSPSFGNVTNIHVRRQMIDRRGCLADLSRIEGIEFEQPYISSRVQRGLYLQEDVKDIVLNLPRVVPGQLSTWKLVEQVETTVYNFTWNQGTDDSGIANPFTIVSDINALYIGPESPFSITDLVRTFTANGVDGIVLAEGDGAIGFSYKAGANLAFHVTPQGHGTFNEGVTLGSGLNFTTSMDPANPTGDAAAVMFTEFFDTKNHLYVKFSTGAKILLATEL